MSNTHNCPCLFFYCPIVSKTEFLSDSLYNGYLMTVVTPLTPALSCGDHLGPYM